MSCKRTYLKPMGWEDIDKLEPDDEPLFDEEWRIILMSREIVISNPFVRSHISRITRC